MTDGERILGLGDLGACGMGIPVGKLSLYTAIGGVSPRYCLPITLDVGCNNDDLVSQHTYIGLSERRTIGAAYDSLVDECMHSITEVYGRNTLIQFEDFANFNAFRFLQKYRNTFCTFNDDIQGTASVVVAGLLAAVRITQIPFIENTFLFLGAGEASLGIAELLVLALVSSGLSIEKARERIFLFDSCGLVVRNRKRGSNAGHKIIFAKNLAETKDFLSAVNLIQPSVLIGAAAVPQAFTEEILSQMAAFNKRPIIFALSNPTKKAECTAQQAYTHTNGQCIFASGSPFPPVTYDGKTFYTGQGNNAYIFPGVGLGVIAAGIKTISEEYFFIAAKALAEKVTDSMLAEGRVYPPLSDIRETSNYISEKIMEHAYKKNQASLFPKPSNILQYIQKICYNCTYETFLPDIYEWK